MAAGERAAFVHVCRASQPVFPLRNWDRKGWSGARRAPRISELIMSHVEGTLSTKLAWLREQKAAGNLDGDDPDEIAEAEILLSMLVRVSSSKGGKERRHLENLLDEGLTGTFPASDPVSVGHFTSTEPPSQPIDRGVVDLSGTHKSKSRRAHPRVRRYG